MYMQVIFKLYGNMTGSVGSERKHVNYESGEGVGVGWGGGIVFCTRAPTTLNTLLKPKFGGKTITVECLARLLFI